LHGRDAYRRLMLRPLLNFTDLSTLTAIDFVR
jgi:hypothetical protein